MIITKILKMFIQRYQYQQKQLILVFINILMGNIECCQAENAEYKPTFIQNEQAKLNIQNVKIAKPPTEQQHPKQVKSEHKPEEKNTEKPIEKPVEKNNLKIQVLVDQSIPIPEPIPPVKSQLQKYDEFNNKIQIDKVVKKFGKQVYVGQISKRGIPQGYGKIFKIDDSVYLGQWKEGKANGKGVFIQKDGSYYEGQFSNNNAQGKGKYITKTFTYEGQFKHNLFQGQGKQKTQQSSFEGEYRLGNKSKGLLTWIGDKFQYSYNGNFNSNNQFNGKGTLRQPSGIYEGNFENNLKDGYGVYRFSNGLRYQGYYSKGKKSGKGILYNCNQSVAYEGSFEDDLPHGEGYVFDSNGKKQSKTWVKGIDAQGLSI